MSRYENEYNFSNVTKKLKENSLGKFLVLGGLGSSVVNALFSNPITGLFESVGVITSAYLLNQTIKGPLELNSMGKEELNNYIGKSAFLAIGGVAIGAVASILPGPIAHVAHYATSGITGGGLIGVATGVYTKVKKAKM
jgi:membrane associated rhomboid family serine protease